MVLVGAFAAIALILASVGVFGVMSYSVSGQTREFGVRLALGAGRAAVTRMVLGRGALLAGSGAALGLIGAVLLTRAMETLLYGVKPGDPLSLAVAAATLIAVALLASYLPARRAAAVDPVIALRTD
jgi:ABC-type antimicrobial peptide transport system permease subunit